MSNFNCGYQFVALIVFKLWTAPLHLIHQELLVHTFMLHAHRLRLLIGDLQQA